MKSVRVQGEWWLQNWKMCKTKVQGVRCKVQGAGCKEQDARCKVVYVRCKVQG